MKKKLQLNKETMAVLNMSEMSRVVGQAAAECPTEGDAIFPHENDCGMFYKCDWGTPVLMNCPDGLHFNAELGVCDFPGNVNCQLDGLTSGHVGCFASVGQGTCTYTVAPSCDSICTIIACN